MPPGQSQLDQLSNDRSLKHLTRDLLDQRDTWHCPVRWAMSRMLMSTCLLVLLVSFTLSMDMVESSNSSQASITDWTKSIDYNGLNVSVKGVVLLDKHEEEVGRGGCEDRVCLSSSYDRLARPSTVDGGPIRVGVFLRQVRVVAIDDHDFTVTLDVNLGLMWHESRLMVDHLRATDDHEVSAVDTKFVSRLWLPELYVRDLKYRSRTLKDLDGRLFIVGKQEVLYQQQLIITVWCPFRYEFYPLDTQRCTINMGGFVYDQSRVVYELRALDYDHQAGENPVLDNIRIWPIFNTHEDDPRYKDGERGRGRASRIGIGITLRRRPFQFIVNYYLPASLFVVVSWASFLIPPSLIPGRMILLVTLFLVLINIFNTLNEKSPRVEGITMINLYVITCILFVFGALAGYAITLRGKRRLELKRNKVAEVATMTDISNTNDLMGHINEALVLEDLEVDQEGDGEPMERPNGHLKDSMSNGKVVANGKVSNVVGNGANFKVNSHEGEVQSKNTNNWHERAYDMRDTMFLITFPLLFLLFNCVYWPILINYKKIFD